MPFRDNSCDTFYEVLETNIIELSDFSTNYIIGTLVKVGIKSIALSDMYLQPFFLSQIEPLPYCNFFWHSI